MKEKIKAITQPQQIKHHAAPYFWFFVGFFLSGIIIAGFVMIYFQQTYKNKVIPGVFIGNEYVGEKTKDEVEKIYNKRNGTIGKNTFTFSYEDNTATLSAQQLEIGYNSTLLAEQAVKLGKTDNIISNIYIILSASINGISLPPSYTFNEEKLENTIEPLARKIYKEPVDALFTVKGNRVTAFRNSTNGQGVDFEAVKKDIQEKASRIVKSKQTTNYTVILPITTIKPDVTTEEVNNFGIVEMIGRGESSFAHSIPSRVHNVMLAASKINGVLVAPGEEFSFVKNLGDVSSYTGYQQAYVIQNGRTVLGDGGGVCQVSTTLFRAILNAGLPITERHPHSYRVGYYEQDAAPGLDATVYYPTVDLKFKNDTGNHILIQSYVDPTNYKMYFTLYGKKDGRTVEMATPVITSQTPPPEALYQDDPNLPKGQVKQVDFAAWGASVAFNWTVKKDGKTLFSKKFTTRYAPWRAVYMRGTKE